MSRNLVYGLKATRDSGLGTKLSRSLSINEARAVKSQNRRIVMEDNIQLSLTKFILSAAAMGASVHNAYIDSESIEKVYGTRYGSGFFLKRFIAGSSYVNIHPT